MRKAGGRKVYSPEVRAVLDRGSEWIILQDPENLGLPERDMQDLAATYLFRLARDEEREAARQVEERQMRKLDGAERQRQAEQQQAERRLNEEI